MNMLNAIEFYQKSPLLKEKAWQALEDQIAEAGYMKNDCACILLDIDHFLSLVEAKGPGIGQSILSKCLRMLQENFASYQVMSYGRDEFMVILAANGIEDTTFLAESMRRKLAEVITTAVNENEISQALGCSAGVAIYPRHAGDAMALLGKAEEGLYLAKRQGRNRTKLPSGESMVLKSNYYSRIQLERLTALANKTGQSEASLLREALDRFLSDSDI